MHIRNALLLTTLIGAATAAPAAAEENRAAVRLSAMATVLAKAPRISVTIDCAYDVVQPSGQKIEYGERRVVALRRPDRARIDVTRREGARRGLLFDGTQLAVFDVDAKVYATAAKPGTVDAAFDYFVNELDMRLPLRDLLAADFPDQLKNVLASAHLVNQEMVGGVATDHVGFRGDTADAQVWIQREGDPLPRRIVITYRLANGQPQFQADLNSWNLAPDLPDTLFAFTPSTDAERIPVLVPRKEKEAMRAATHRAAASAALLLLMAVVTEVAARGGRGGGGRGGFAGRGAASRGSFGQGQAGAGVQRGGYDRNGPAASGTFPGRSSGRYDGRGQQGWDGSRQDERANRQEERHQHRDDVRNDWQNDAANRREDWQDYADDHYDDRGDYYDDDIDHPYGAAIVAGAVAGAVVAEAVAPPYWILPCTPTTVVVGATTYYHCDSAWYIRVYRGDDVAYTMVNPPAGY